MADMPDSVNDLLRDAREADKVDKERAELFEALVKSPGWLAYVELLEGRLTQLGETVLAPAGSVNGALVLEYEKGTMRGLMVARDLPSIIIAAMKPAPAPEETDK